MFSKFLIQAQSKPELIVLMLMIMIIAMLIVPLPTVLVDFLIGFNIVIALLIFMGSFYIVKILELSTFPSILLITTLFRLALSISTSRLILLEADAGDIILTFGQFVIGDNLVVGFVVFSIVTIVQFIVITKGSERVAEVAARFSLDGMPGKQMSIDADLKAGVIDNEGVKQRRSDLEKESQLYGAFDGAMKFIKGDAIAGIIVIFVNFIGGISVGMVQHAMPLSQAMSTYSILTIGDGLVAQIPALLISISAGFIVTRVSGSESNLGQNIIRELFSNPFVLAVTSVLALAIAFLPGFPKFVFITLAVLLGAMYYRRVWAGKKSGGKGGKQGKQDDASPKKGSFFGKKDQDKESDPEYDSIDDVIPETVPLMLIASESHREILEKARVVDRIKRDIFIDFGVKLPNIVSSYSPHAEKNTVILMINEIRAATIPLVFGYQKVIGPADETLALGFDAIQVEDGAGMRSIWINESQKARLDQLGHANRSAVEELYMCFAALLARNITEFFGVQETKNLLDDLEKKYPELLKEAYRHATVQRVSEVFQRLLMEKISIRNMKLILEALVQWAPKEKDPIMLVEHVRSSLARYISNKFSSGGQIRAVVISASMEETIRNGIRQTSTGSFLNLDPAQAEEILDLLALSLDGLHLSLRDVVVLASMDIRRFVKKLLENRFQELEVLSFSEISEGTNVNVIRTI